MEGLVSSFGLDWRVFLGEVVNFIILLGIIYWVISKYVTPLLEERRQVIKDGVEKSEKAAETLADAQTERTAILSKADADATERISESVEKAKKRESEILATAQDKAAETLAQAKSKGESEKQAIIDSSQEDIAKMIVLGTEKVLRTK